MICERCGAKAMSYIGSMFNTQLICMECKDREIAHPEYEFARETEIEAVKRGNYHFPGIGLPADLRGEYEARTKG